MFRRSFLVGLFAVVVAAPQTLAAVCRRISIGFRPNKEWTPAELFVESKGGAWHDPSDLGTLWQDIERRVPALVVGDPVRVMDDKSGHGHHMYARGDSVGCIEDDGSISLTGRFSSTDMQSKEG